MPGIILSVDIGTSSLKAALIDLDGRLKAFSRMAYSAGSGAVCAEDWEYAFVCATGDLHAQAPDLGIDGICVSGNGPTLVPISRDGEALPPLYWNDGRTLLPSGGKTTSFFLPHAAWFKNNSLLEYEKTRLFMSSHEWLASRLGAEALTVLPSELYKPWYWDDEQCRLFGLDRNKFPPFVKMGSVMGKVSPDAAERLAASFPGLKSGTPIIAGGPDFITALIGTGTVRPGDVCDRAGTSEGINVCVSGEPPEAAVKGKGFRVLPHAMEGLWNVGAVIPSSGKLFECYRSETGLGSMSYAELLGGLIPLDKSGDENTVRGREVLCAIGLSVRSALEGLALSGFTVKEMRVSGGQGKNPLWNQLKADITGVKLMIPEIPDGELAGNAVISAAALGESGSRGKTGLAEMMNRMIRFREIYKPNPETAPLWEEQYRLYRGQSS
jgi:xylulokinase